MSWVTIAGEEDTELEAELAARVERKIAAGDYKDNDIKYLRNHELPVTARSIEMDSKVLEKLRVLAATWDVRVQPSDITSHRPFIGQFIVGVKKALFPILDVLLKDTLRKQRDFNAALIELIAELHKKEEENRESFK